MMDRKDNTGRIDKRKENFGMIYKRIEKNVNIDI